MTTIHNRARCLSLASSQLNPLNNINTMDPPSVDQKRLSKMLEELQEEFELNDEQVAALPVLDDIDLIPQSDSHHIQTEEVGVRTAHPYKLFIGESKGEPIYVYLFKQTRARQMKIEINSVDEDGESFWGLDPQFFANVDNLAYPFIEWEGIGRFFAAVKFYFLLGLRVGLYPDDPGFSMSKTWRGDLQGACNDLIKANELIAAEERAKKTARSGKQHRPPPQPRLPPPSPEKDVRPQASQPPVDKMPKRALEDYQYDRPMRQWAPPHYPAIPQPLYGTPPMQAEAHYASHRFGTPLPHDGALPPGYGDTPPPAIYYSPGPNGFHSSRQSVGNPYGSPAPGSDHLSLHEDELRLPVPRKEGRRKLSTSDKILSATSKAKEKSSTPFRKPSTPASARRASLHDMERSETPARRPSTMASDRSLSGETGGRLATPYEKYSLKRRSTSILGDFELDSEAL
jgi:hypothetical protein